MNDERIELLELDGSWKEISFWKFDHNSLIRFFDFPVNTVSYYNGEQYLQYFDECYSSDRDVLVRNLFKYIRRHPVYFSYIERMVLWYGWLTEDQLLLMKSLSEFYY